MTLLKLSEVAEMLVFDRHYRGREDSGPNQRNFVMLGSSALLGPRCQDHFGTKLVGIVVKWGASL